MRQSDAHGLSPVSVTCVNSAQPLDWTSQSMHSTVHVIRFENKSGSTSGMERGSFCSIRQDTSFDMHVYLFWSPRYFNVMWSEVIWGHIFTLTVGVSKYMLQCVSTTETRWRLNYRSSVLRSKVIDDKAHFYLRFYLPLEVNSYTMIL